MSSLFIPVATILVSVAAGPIVLVSVIAVFRVLVLAVCRLGVCGLVEESLDVKG